MTLEHILTIPLPRKAPLLPAVVAVVAVGRNTKETCCAIGLRCSVVYSLNEFLESHQFYNFQVTIRTTMGSLIGFFFAVMLSAFILRYALYYLFLDVHIPPDTQLPRGPKGMNLTTRRAYVC